MEHLNNLLNAVKANPQYHVLLLFAGLQLFILVVYALISGRRQQKVKKDFSGIDDKSVDNYLGKLSENAETGRQIIEGLDEQIGQRRKDNVHLENEKNRLEKEIQDLKSNPDSFADKLYQSHRKEIAAVSQKIRSRANWRAFFIWLFGGLLGAAAMIYWTVTHPDFIPNLMGFLKLK